MYSSTRDLHVLTHSVPTHCSSDLCDATRLTRPAPSGRRRPASNSDGRYRAASQALSTSAAPRGYVPRRTGGRRDRTPVRSEEHTSELQSLMRISYAVFCLKKKKRATTSQATAHTAEHVLHI